VLEVPTFPASSTARAVSVCGPLPAFAFSALQSSKLFASCDEILLNAAVAYFPYSAVALAASVAALPRCVLCESFSWAIEGCSTEESVEQVRTPDAGA
jgi:hypothetical protein